jgi:hypothetical protein
MKIKWVGALNALWDKRHSSKYRRQEAKKEIQKEINT